MQLPETSHTAASNVVRLADGSRKTRVLFAGDMEFARAQFASVAPQLQLMPAAADAGPASDTPDVALIDCGAPGVDARAVAEGVRARGLDIPIVLALDPAAAGENGATRVTAELRVDDYTVKLPGWLARLPARLEFAIAHHRRRRSLEALQASSERLRTVVESAPVCLARIARDGTILAMNAASMKMVGAQEPEDILGKSLLSLVASSAAEPVRRFLDAVSAGQPGSLEFEASAGGASRVVDARAVPLNADAEGRASALLVLRDATERKRLEESVVSTALAAGEAGTAEVAAERDRLRAELDAAVAERRRLESERDALRADATEARARAAMVDHVRAACATAEQELSRIQADHQRLAAERDGLVEELAGARLRHDAAEAEHQARREALEAQLHSLEAAQAAEREAHRATRHQAQEADALAGERATLLASLDSLRGRFDEMSVALDASEARHAAEIQTHKNAAALAEARLREVETARVEASTQIEELRAALEEARHTAARVHESAAETQRGLEAQIAEAAAARQAVEQQVAALETRMAALAGERDGLRTELDTARAAIGELEAAVRDSRMGRDARLANAEAIRDALQLRVKELDARLTEAAAERDALRAQLDTAQAEIERLQSAVREASTGTDARLAAAEAAREALEHQMRDLQTRLDTVGAERNAVREELDEAVRAAQARQQQLHVGIEEIRASRDAQAAHGEALRRDLADRIEQLEARIEASTAERDALHNEMRLALEAANARNARLQASLDHHAPHRDAAADEAARHALAGRVEELSARLDAVIEERNALERMLESARTEHEVRLREAAAQREALEARIAERHAENGRLLAQLAALQSESAADEAGAAQACPPPGSDLQDAQTAFREAVQLLSGELQTAVQATRAEQARLRVQPAEYYATEERLREIEADCRRVAAERDEREATVRALQAEVRQLVELRREQRRELVRALQESEEAERRAAARLAECVRLRQMLSEAQAVLQRLSRWAATQSTRLAPSATPQKSVPVDAPPATTGTGDTGAPGAPAEESWS